MDPILVMMFFTLICKPEQSGKTFLMIHKIIENYQNKKEGERIINIILCDNSLLLNKQTKKRLETDLESLIFKGTKYIELSSGKDADCKKIDEVFAKIIHDNVDNIIMCTNNKRISDIEKIITYIYDIKDKHLDTFKFNIWLDEADKYIGYIEGTLIPIAEEFNNNEDNIHIWGITATPEELFKKYNYLQVYPINDTTSENYHGWDDNNIIHYIKCDLYKFIKKVLNENNNLIKKGTKWFIPGKSTKKSHKNISEICKNYGMVTIIVNGDGIEIIFPNKKPRLYKKNEEFNKKLINIYKENNLYKYPVVITGLLCISRGISIMSNHFIFDYAILSLNSKKKQEISQLAGRLKGNIKNLENYKVPTIFTTKRFDKIAGEMEFKSRELGKIAARKEDEEGFSIIGKKEYDQIDNVKTVPILISCGEDDFNELIKKNNNSYDEKLIKLYIENKLGKPIFNGYEKDQISMPGTEDSYKKNIVELTKASNENRVYLIAIKAVNKSKNVYQIWFDYKNHNIIISLYNGGNKRVKNKKAYKPIIEV